MAKKSDDDKIAVKTHPLVAKLNPNPDDPPNLVALRGYIGPAKEKGHVCIHHSLDFSSYTEVPKDAIRHVEPVDPSNENSPTVVLIPADTRVRHVRKTVQTGEAGFLAGGIAASRLRGIASSFSCGNDTIVQPTVCCPSGPDVPTQLPNCPPPTQPPAC